MSDTEELAVSVTSHGLTSLLSEEGKTAKLSRLKHSNFFITVNTNKIFTEFQQTALEAAALELDRVWMEILQNLRSYLVVPEDFSPHQIKRIEEEHSIELGPESKMLHLHAVLMIEHRTMLKLDYTRLRGALKAGIHPDNAKGGIHFDSRTFRDTKLTLREYIFKNARLLKDRGYDLNFQVPD